jgi:hypothetical protein
MPPTGNSAPDAWSETFRFEIGFGFLAGGILRQFVTADDLSVVEFGTVDEASADGQANRPNDLDRGCAAGETRAFAEHQPGEEFFPLHRHGPGRGVDAVVAKKR